MALLKKGIYLRLLLLKKAIYKIWWTRFHNNLLHYPLTFYTEHYLYLSCHWLHTQRPLRRDLGILVMGVGLTSHWTAAVFTGLLSVPGWGWVKGWMKELFFFNFQKSGAHGEMILTRKNRRTWRKTCPSATLSTTYPTGLAWTRNQAAAVGGRRLTAWAMTRPTMVLLHQLWISDSQGSRFHSQFQNGWRTSDNNTTFITVNANQQIHFSLFIADTLIRYIY
jgi:hypothetical protein